MGVYYGINVVAQVQGFVGRMPSFGRILEIGGRAVFVVHTGRVSTRASGM